MLSEDGHSAGLYTLPWVFKNCTTHGVAGSHVVGLICCLSCMGVRQAKGRDKPGDSGTRKQHCDT